jgi:hypothetical protein
MKRREFTTLLGGAGKQVRWHGETERLCGLLLMMVAIHELELRTVS